MRYTKNVVEPSILASGRLARAVCAGPGSVKNIDYRVIVRSAKRRDRVTRSRLQHADQALIFRFPVTVPVWSYRPGWLLGHRDRVRPNAMPESEGSPA